MPSNTRLELERRRRNMRRPKSASLGEGRVVWRSYVKTAKEASTLYGAKLICSGWRRVQNVVVRRNKPRKKIPQSIFWCFFFMPSNTRFELTSAGCPQRRGVRGTARPVDEEAVPQNWQKPDEYERALAREVWIAGFNWVIQISPSPPYKKQPPLKRLLNVLLEISSCVAILSGFVFPAQNRDYLKCINVFSSKLLFTLKMVLPKAIFLPFSSRTP